MKNNMERNNIIGWTTNVNNIEFYDDLTTNVDPIAIQSTTILTCKRLMIEEPFMSLLYNLEVNLTQTTDYFNDHKRVYQLDPNPTP